ncbi:chloride channel protein [Nocardioides sp.]|uniref:chloride channel protein n=1 Tax=Nocardioides sp. TaxID=35761 RepID=UPI003D11DA69
MNRRTAVLALVLGAAIGVLSGIYLRLVHFLQHLLWHGTESRLPLPDSLGILAVCVGGGLLVGVLRHRHDRDAPHDLEDALVELDRLVGAEGAPKPAPRVEWLLRAALLGVVSLAAGASLGPEAPLLVLAMGLGQRAARMMRITNSEAAYLSAAGALSGLFGGPLGSVMLPVERSASPLQATRMLGAGIVASIAGLVAMFAVLPNGDGLRYALPDAGVDTGWDLLVALEWAALAAVPATFAGFALLAGTAPLRALAERWMPSTVVRAMAGGLVLALCGIASPLTLFSGEHQGQDLLDTLEDRSVLALLALVALKLIATLACLATGWFGGQIFPAIFAGMAAGLMVAAAFPAATVTAVFAAGAGAAGAAVLRRPLAVTLFLLFFFPAPALLAVVTGAGVATLIISLLGDRAPEPTSMDPSAH